MLNDVRCMNRWLQSIAVVSCLLLYTSTAPAVDVFVDPSAAPGGNGSHERPFRSLESAMQGMRAWREAHPDVNESIRIHLATGIYPTLNTVRLDADDSGTASAPFEIVGPRHGEARIVGGAILAQPTLQRIEHEELLQRIQSEEAREHLRLIDLTSHLDQDALAHLAGPVHRGMGTPVRPIASELFWNGEALTRARWPNEGFATVSAIIDTGSVPRNRAEDIAPEKRETGPERGGVFRFDDPERVQRWARAQDAWVSGYWHWDWADEQLPVASTDPSQNEIRLGLPHRYGLRDGARFYITNVLEEIDMPGEFIIDAERGCAYLWPPDHDEPLTELMISLSSEPLIELRSASHLTVSNIIFEGTRGAAFVTDACDHVAVSNCTFRNIGTQAIVVDGRHNRVEHCELHAIGARAIGVRGGDRATLTPADNEIVNNHIHDFGRVYRTYQPAIGLSGVGQHIAHNRIHDAPHSAIMFGGNDHLIELNEIFNVLTETGDCGAIYCGRDWTLHGTVIRHNFFHHLEGTNNRYQNAVYLDDMASGIHVLGNVFYNCNWGMLVGGGRDNLISGNVFIGGRMAVSFDARGVGWMASHIADPSTSTLHKNLAAVPYEQPPWSERFPQLQSYLSDQFGRPVGSAIVGNALVNTKLGRVDDRECVRVEGNVTHSIPLDSLFVDPNAAPSQWRFRIPQLGIEAIGGFATIPVGEIGFHEREQDS